MEENPFKDESKISIRFDCSKNYFWVVFSWKTLSNRKFLNYKLFLIYKLSSLKYLIHFYSLRLISNGYKGLTLINTLIYSSPYRIFCYWLLWLKDGSLRSSFHDLFLLYKSWLGYQFYEEKSYRLFIFINNKIYKFIILSWIIFFIFNFFVELVDFLFQTLFMLFVCF